ncbi:hypothetical protein E2P81_ATG00059 [Venturia nashicola]|nr:hypothetical protein E2P81_ATG00059 [Venturia nashicola]
MAFLLRVGSDPKSGSRQGKEKTTDGDPLVHVLEMKRDDKLKQTHKVTAILGWIRQHVRSGLLGVFIRASS